jgi:hypothetical protein
MISPLWHNGPNFSIAVRRFPMAGAKKAVFLANFIR